MSCRSTLPFGVAIAVDQHWPGLEVFDIRSPRRSPRYSALLATEDFIKDMDTDGVVGDASVAPPQPHSMSFTSYNISLNLSSIFSFLPSRILARIRKGGEHRFVSSDLPTASVAHLVAEEWARGGAIDESGILSSSIGVESDSTTGSMDAGSHMSPSLPSPWGFFTSGYMLGLFIMAVILHRMQNVIIPSRFHPRRHNRHRSPTTYGQLLILRRLYASLLPVDMSRAATRLVFHLPSLYFLSKMLLLWFLLILQTSDMYPTNLNNKLGMKWMEELANWSQRKEMNDICWSTFCAVCGAFCVEGFAKALDGIGSGLLHGGSMNPSTSPFNLVGYAFILHVYSSPVAHAFKPDGLPSRPDKHVLIIIAIPLLQLTIFHCLAISKRLSTHRLIPTALSSFLSLLHFHITLWSHFLSPSSPAPSRTSTSGTYSNYNGHGHPTLTGGYPLLNYIPNVFESILILTIMLTVCLNAIVQLLVRGRVDRVFSGLGLSRGGHDDDGLGFHLPYDEEFGVLLLRVGTASLEATGLRGWGNEVAPVQVPIHRRRHLPKTRHPANERGAVKMSRTGVFSVSRGTSSICGKQRQTRGFSNEVRNVDLGLAPEHGNVVGWSWWGWIKEVVRFLDAALGVTKGVVVWLWRRARGRVPKGRSRDVVVEQDQQLEAQSVPGEDLHQSDLAEDGDSDVYERFLRGENISEDDSEDEYVDDDEDDEDDEVEINDADEAVGLFSDFLQDRTNEGSDMRGEMVLAHLMHESADPSAGPLTRRRWGAMLSGGSSIREALEMEKTWNDENDEVPLSRALSVERELDREQEIVARNLCVICTSEAREVICWPCRCLAMCDNCRESLASRSAPPKHRCPCCRQIVEGYSRIYIP